MEKKIPSRKYLTILSVLLVAVIALAVTGAYHANSFRSQPIFLFILIIGLGLSLGLGMVRGGLAALVLIAAAVGIKQSLGVWHQANLVSNLIEIATAGVAFAVAAYYHDQLKLVLDAYYNNVSRLEKLNLIDNRVGLIKEAVGRLRLTEEEERSVRYKRPFSLILARVNFKGRAERSQEIQAAIMRLTANVVKGTTRSTDIPFQAASDQIALILPETAMAGGQKVIENIIRRMPEAYYTGNNGEHIGLFDMASITLGAASFTGTSRSAIDMYTAVKSSLDEMSARQFNSDIAEPSWQVVGEQPAAVPAPAAEPRDPASQG